ncbi:RE1 [Symbiodinium microadriaticum]|nr:RE1 [Symbiodinium microadriaticum]
MFSRWGWSVARPVNTELVGDPYDADGRSLLKCVDRYEPRLVLIRCPRNVWWSQNMPIGDTSQERRRVRKLKQKHENFFRVCERVFERQIKRSGDDAIMVTGNQQTDQPMTQALEDPTEVDEEELLEDVPMGDAERTHRTTNIPPCSITFGDEVHLDCICVHDSVPESHWFLSIVDRATSYHVVELLRDHTPIELNKAFDRAWAKWAGPPLRVSVDFEGGFRGKEFWTKVGEAGTSLVSIAGTAHWQAGKVERHNQTVKDMLRTVIRQTGAKGREQMKGVAREVGWAKNSLVREHGWAPNALVFGKEPRVFGELHSQGEPNAFHPRVGDADSEVARRMRYRYHAKIEYIKSQARHMLARTAHNRVRKITNPRIGQLVFFWRAEKKKEPSRWVGPGYIVGLQGHNAWVAVGGRCFLVAGEHLREACGDEKHYGDPQIQKAIALFKKVPEEATFEDLTGQQPPAEEPSTMEDQPMCQDVARDIGDVAEGAADLPTSLAKLAGTVGWNHDELGNPLLVTYQAWAFRTPESKYEAHRFPYRSTWARFEGEWSCLERECKWIEMSNPHEFLPRAPAEILITVFHGRTRKEMCLEDVPYFIKRHKAGEHQVQTVQLGGVIGKNKLKRMMEKEIPYDQIPESEREVYRQAEEKEWGSWNQYESCEVLSEEESSRLERECPSRILPSRYVYRNKNAGLVDEAGKALPTRAKARLCLQGHLCPDSRSGQVQVDSPTVERVSTMLFLHMVVSFGWLKHWYIGDISNAFLQGAPLQGKPMYMRPPKQGLKGVGPGQLLRLLKPVYGRPDAPRAWYEELAKVLVQEIGFSKSQIDPAMFMLRNQQGVLVGCMIVHVDDLMVCHDGSTFATQAVERLGKRFPFGTWENVSEKPSGVTYCGKEIKIVKDNSGEYVSLSQNAFLDGRLQEMEIAKERRKSPESLATPEEMANYRSVVGSLQWLATQSRPDLCFETNQLQKRISDLRVCDLIRANKAVREADSNRMQIVFRDLGRDAQLVVYTDAGLYSSVGVEIDERECEDLLLSDKSKRLVYSQKGAVVGFVRKGSTDIRGELAHINVLDWRSTTNKRVIESSFCAETHAALMAIGMGHFCQVLMSELRFGSDVVGAVEDDGWNDLVAMSLITDCKSIYDTVHKDGQHVSDKSGVIQAVLLCVSF